MAFDIGSIFDSRDSINYLVSQYIQLESRPRDRIIENREKLTKKQQTLTTLDSKLSALNSSAERMTDEITDYFALKTAKSSKEEYLLATAGSNAALGTHAITVERLATSDTRVSKQYSSDSTDLSSFGSDQTFTMQVGHYYLDNLTDSPTKGQKIYQRVDINVTVAAASLAKKNSEALADIASAINNAMSTALITDHDYDGNDTNEKKLDSIDIVRAEVVSEDGGNSRLVLKSASSGYSYRIDFTDSADSFLSGLEVSNNSQMSGSSGGFITNVGTGVTDSLLNSNFEVNGLTFYRDSNNVTDALTGVTLDLLNTFTIPQSVTVSADVDGVKKEVQDFLDAFNGSIDYLRENAEMNPETKERGVLADDGLYRQMTSTLRSKLNTIVSNTSSSTYDRLFDLGIESDTTGHYSIVDSSKFEMALNSSTKNVSDLFNATDGIGTLVKTYVNAFVKVGGSIDSSKSSLQDSILQLNTRITYWDEVLAKREIQLRDEFTRIQTMMSQLSQQQSFINNFK
ncbi:MAG TPA: flagellar filament capping protein FliD [Candidatus Marinimicrobia bacterium]|mgnify:FL=1|jgi:flagellar hook-associated protein 2|nr:flagellar filament capping protein FliD [Candidatus Neomarinimicrobiota bacterium]|tara:strand:+ start:2073 stop:3614 length:1542 start_codon:yes stop_codon:yes gene_type:complete